MLAARIGVVVGLTLFVHQPGILPRNCVNGQVQALCTNAWEIRPICSPTICALVPPSIRPIEMPRIPPIGTTSCSNQQVLSPYTRQYEWRQLCR